MKRIETNQQEWFTMRQFVQKYSLAKSTVYLMVKRGDIEILRIGKFVHRYRLKENTPMQPLNTTSETQANKSVLSECKEDSSQTEQVGVKHTETMTDINGGTPLVDLSEKNWIALKEMLLVKYPVLSEILIGVKFVQRHDISLEYLKSRVEAGEVIQVVRDNIPCIQWVNP